MGSVCIILGGIDFQGVFLSLHLWANAVLALVYHPELLKSPSGIETPLSQSMSRSLKLALASSRQISECMIFADLVAEASYVSCSVRIRADVRYPLHGSFNLFTSQRKWSNPHFDKSLIRVGWP